MITTEFKNSCKVYFVDFKKMSNDELIYISLFLVGELKERKKIEKNLKRLGKKNEKK